jgi:ribosomal protein S18 acetylase RimI-like enzyme
MTVRTLQSADLEAVAVRVRDRLAHDAQRNPLVNPDFSVDAFVAALMHASDQTWVDEVQGRIVGHLFGALLDSVEHGRGAWVGPDGVSFDSDVALGDLYGEASATWIRRGATEHFAWVFDADEDAGPWLALGFVPAHRRGIMSLSELISVPAPVGYVIRRGSIADLELAVSLDRVIDEAQSPNSSPPPDQLEVASGWRDLLEDDEVHHYVVEFNGVGVAQCVSYPLNLRRGSFDHTIHLSAVAVLRGHEHRGVARAMISAALRDARSAGFLYAEVNWSVANQRAELFWTRYGFHRTYLRLRRSVTSN